MTRAEKIQVLKDIANGVVTIDTSPTVYIVEMVKGSDMLTVNGVLYSQFEYDELLQYNLDNGISVPVFMCCRDYGKYGTKEAFKAHCEKELKKERKRIKQQQEQAQREALNKPQESVMHPVKVHTKPTPIEAKIGEIIRQEMQMPTSGLMSEYGIKWRFTKHN